MRLTATISQVNGACFDGTIANSAPSKAACIGKPISLIASIDLQFLSLTRDYRPQDHGIEISFAL